GRGGGLHRRAWLAERLELLGRDDEHAAQVARAVAVSGLLADARLLLGTDRRGVAEGKAAVIVADAVDVAGAVVGEAEERTDGFGAFRELREEGTAFRLSGRIGRGRLLALA